MQLTLKNKNMMTDEELESGLDFQTFLRGFPLVTSYLFHLEIHSIIVKFLFYFWEIWNA